MSKKERQVNSRIEVSNGILKCIKSEMPVDSLSVERDQRSVSSEERLEMNEEFRLR